MFGQSYSNSDNSYGVYGAAIGGSGVYGFASGAGAGVKGSNDNKLGYGVYGVNSAYGGTGVHGESSSTTGNGTGKSGYTASTDNSAAGVQGFAQSGVGVRGISRDSVGVVGFSNFGYGVYSYGDFGATGTKTAIVHTSQGNRKLYSQESPEVWFDDFGEGQLKGGKAHIDLDPLFLETVTINDQNLLKVFFQLNDDCNGVYVQRQATGFEVKELRAGTSNARFTYLVVAKRKGLETARLEGAPDTPKTAALPVPLKVTQK